MSSKTCLRKLCSLGVFAVFIFLPQCTHAAVIINEVMYDVPGADTGHEWIEIENIGPSEFDLTAKDLRFSDRGGKHLLTLYGGSGVISAGGVAILADKPAVFLADHPSWQGALFDSAFSLTATQTIGLTEDADTLDSVSYTSTLGAKGDGQSLHRVGATFISGPANPGNAGIPAKPITVADSFSKGQADAIPAESAVAKDPSPTHNITPHADAISAPTPAENPAGVGAALPTPSYGQVFSSLWFAGFLTLLVFSAISLIVIRRTHA